MYCEKSPFIVSSELIRFYSLRNLFWMEKYWYFSVYLKRKKTVQMKLNISETES
jgi:hypothetical protein